MELKLQINAPATYNSTLLANWNLVVESSQIVKISINFNQMNMAGFNSITLHTKSWHG
jgi:hypothetical protein